METKTVQKSKAETPVILNEMPIPPWLVIVLVLVFLVGTLMTLLRKVK